MQDDTLLVIGWGTSVKIAVMRKKASNIVAGSQKDVLNTSIAYVDIVASFQTSYYISGIAPCGDSLVILAYIHEEEEGVNEFSSLMPSRQVLFYYCHFFKSVLFYI